MIPNVIKWLRDRLIIPGSPVLLHYLAHYTARVPLVFPPLSFAASAIALPLVTWKDYRKDMIWATCILPATFLGAFFVLAVLESNKNPHTASVFHWLGFWAWLILLLINAGYKLCRRVFQ